MNKHKKLLALFVLCFSFFIFFNSINAATAVINDPEGVNLRKEPGTNKAIIVAIPYGKTVNLLSTDKFSGDGCSSGWYKVQYSSYTGYLCSSMVTVSASSEGTTTYNGYYTSDSWGTRISEDYASVRATASFSSSIDTLYMGTKVKILEKGSTWTKISYYNNKTGYVLTKLVKSYEDLTATDEAYYNTLRQAGFPESYLPFLTKIHKQHPNWVFKAEKTNKDFSTAVNQEVGKNYIQTNIDSYRLSNKPAEGSTWYVASSSVVAVYMDPRNYLNDTNIFAFEKLSYDSKTQTNSIVKNIFGSSYLSSDNYVNTFMNAGKTYNISPVHLAARVKQEGGTNENYDGVSGKSTLKYGGKSLSGYYNYYNIGAYQDSVTSSPVARGLAVAAGIVSNGDFDGTPWNTREKAITYGAKFIADSYINKGQDLLYYQKFNVGPNAYYTEYTNQYMTNVVAPASEALSTHDTYKDNKIIDTAFTFYIPVYNNTPSTYTILPPIGDTNNNVKDIKIDGTTINGFDKDVLEYTTYVAYDKTSVNLTATKESNNATLTGTGTIKLNNKTTQAKITVTSQTGEVKTYTITIIKQDKPADPSNKTVEEIMNKINIKYQDGYLTYIKQNTTGTELSNTIYSKDANAKVTITDKNNKTKTNSNLATGDKLKVTIDNDTKTYTLSVKGDCSGDGKITILDLLKIQKAILNKSPLSGEYKVAADTNYDGKITILDLLRVQKAILGKTTLQ